MVRTNKNATTVVYNKITKPEFFLINQGYKNAPITEYVHAFKNFVHSYNVEIRNLFIPEVQLKKYKIGD